MYSEQWNIKHTVLDDVERVQLLLNKKKTIIYIYYSADIYDFIYYYILIYYYIYNNIYITDIIYNNI